MLRIFVDIDRDSDGVPDKESFKILEGTAMKVFYDPRTDTLNVILKDNVAVHESDEDKPGVILDYDKEGNLISLEILDASKRVTDTCKVDFQMAE